MRRLERWLHQHIFKVGWLVTKQYQTTTILYYAFFLPGIVLYELVFWLIAGFLNVRADRAISWPEKQEIGELNLGFIKLSKNVGQFPLAIISTAPLITGLAAVAFIANNRLDFQGFITAMGSGFLDDVGAAVSRLVSAPDFWIWIYLVFTISNTMWPDVSKLRGWRVVLIALAIAGAVLIVIGAGNQVIVDTLSGPVTNALNIFSGTLAVIIGIDLFVVAVLGTIEAIIERVTGDSATFKNGKMITMRREELIKQQAAERTTTRQQKATRAPALPAGPPSIYKMTLPIPGAPGKEAVTRDEGIVISKPPTPAIAATTTPTVTRSEPAVIPGSVADRPTPTATPAFNPGTSGARPALPGSTQPTSSTPRPGAPTTPASRPGISAAQSTSPTSSTPRPGAPTATSSPTTPTSRPGISPSTPAPKPAFSTSSPLTSSASPTAKPPASSGPSMRSGLLDDDDEDDFEEDEEIDNDDDLTYEDAEDPA
ncbi:MAG: hypothetical protein ABI690_32305 [Chloroflexota bacterium]